MAAQEVVAEEDSPMSAVLRGKILEAIAVDTVSGPNGGRKSSDMWLVPLYFK